MQTIKDKRVFHRTTPEHCSILTNQTFFQFVPFVPIFFMPYFVFLLFLPKFILSLYLCLVTSIPLYFLLCVYCSSTLFPPSLLPYLISFYHSLFCLAGVSVLERLVRR